MPTLSTAQKIGFNAFTSSLQVLVVGAIYFFLYAFLLRRLGAPLLGVWSLVLSTASLATMANLGITASLVKFIAEFEAQGNKEDIARLLYTAFISIIFFFGILIIALYFVLLIVLKYIVSAEYIALAIKMLPYSLASLFLNEAGGVFTSVLDGLQKNYRKNIIYMVSSILMLAACYLLVPNLGLIGVAYAQVGQALFVAVTAFLSALKLIDFKKFISAGWDKGIFKKIFSFGVKFQAISVCQMLYEPTTKALISRFAGMSSLGYYEMGSRLVNQIRALIVNANQVVVPVVAGAAIKNKEAISKIYTNSMSLVLFITVPLMTGLIFFAPLISLLWIGHIESVFVFSVIILSIGMFFNILGTPAYYGFMGEGKLNTILIMHIVIGVINPAAGWLFSLITHQYGSMLGWGISLVIGSSKILLNYQKQKKISFSHFFGTKDYLLIYAGIFITAITIIFYPTLSNKLNSNLPFWASLLFIVYSMIYVPTLLINQNFKLILSLCLSFVKSKKLS